MLSHRANPDIDPVFPRSPKLTSLSRASYLLEGSLGVDDSIPDVCVHDHGFNCSETLPTPSGGRMAALAESPF